MYQALSQEKGSQKNGAKRVTRRQKITVDLSYILKDLRAQASLSYPLFHRNMGPPSLGQNEGPHGRILHTTSCIGACDYNSKPDSGVPGPRLGV